MQKEVRAEHVARIIKQEFDALPKDKHIVHAYPFDNRFEQLPKNVHSFWGNPTRRLEIIVRYCTNGYGSDMYRTGGVVVVAQVQRKYGYTNKKIKVKSGYTDKRLEKAIRRAYNWGVDALWLCLAQEFLENVIEPLPQKAKDSLDRYGQKHGIEVCYQDMTLQDIELWFKKIEKYHDKQKMDDLSTRWGQLMVAVNT